MSEFKYKKTDDDPDCPIIMVDDSDTDTFIAQCVFKKTGLVNPFLTFDNGEDLLQYLSDAKKGEKPLPVTILLDINMPGLTGFDVLARIRAQAEFVEVPVVFMLSHSDNLEDRDKSIELGADGFQTKPADLEDYAKFLQELNP